MNWINRRYLWILVGIILLSMLGLIAIQSYWINNSYHIKEKYFSYQVNNALSEVIAQLETQETVFEISNEVFQMADNKDSLVDRSVNKFDQSLKNYKSDYRTLANRSSVTMSGSASKIDTSINYINPHANKKANKEPFLEISSTDVKDILKNKVDNQTLFVEKIVNQILNYNEDVMKRIEKVDLQALIKKNLNDHDIQIEFEYAIRSDGKIKYSTEAFKEERSKLYSKQLFPNNLFHDSDFLELYIPDRTSFIVRTMIPIIVITIVLTFLIIGLVIFNFIVIVRQKKLGDIKNDFVNNLTHELKTPIATISLAGQMLSDKDIVSSKTSIERYAGIINQEAKRLTDQVEKVLQIALLDKGDIKLKNKKIDLNELVRTAIDSFQIKIDNYHGRLNGNLCNDALWLSIDETHMSNLIHNLLDNALKYREGAPIINIFTAQDEQDIYLTVQDNGIGISKVDQLRIFEKFYRVETGNVHNIKGFGLGLSYVKKIVDIYKGKIEVKSKLKQGSSFTIRLPKPDFSQIDAL